jgi:hypothetical protein
MYENSVVALHKILESPTGDRSIHSSDVSCKLSTIPPQVTYLENGLKYYCIEVTCDDGREFAIQEYGDEAETLFREAHKCIFCPHTSYISELESLGIKPNHINELNDNYEMENLVSNIKQSFFQDYKSSDVHGLSL